MVKESRIWKEGGGDKGANLEGGKETGVQIWRGKGDRGVNLEGEGRKGCNFGGGRGVNIEVKVSNQAMRGRKSKDGRNWDKQGN